MKNIVSALMISVTLFGSSSFAQSAGSVTIDENAVAGQSEYAMANQEMILLYNQIKANFDKDANNADKTLREYGIESAKRFENAQRAFVMYRRLNSGAEGALVLGGTLEPMYINQKALEMTKQRVQELKKFRHDLINF